MDVSEVKQHKAELEETLKSAVGRFQEKTGVLVYAVDITQIDATPIGVKGRTALTHLRVRLTWDD